MPIVVCRYSTANAGVRVAKYSEGYQAKNEPIYGYEKGSPERLELDEKLAQYSSTVHDVPIVIGDDEIRSGKTMHQVMVRLRDSCKALCIDTSTHHLGRNITGRVTGGRWRVTGGYKIRSKKIFKNHRYCQQTWGI